MSLPADFLENSICCSHREVTRNFVFAFAFTQCKWFLMVRSRLKFIRCGLLRAPNHEKWVHNLLHKSTYSNRRYTIIVFFPENFICPFGQVNWNQLVRKQNWFCWGWADECYDTDCCLCVNFPRLSFAVHWLCTLHVNFADRRLYRNG